MKQANPRVAFLVAALPAVCSLTNTSLAQVPEGFEMVVLRTTTAVVSRPDINDKGQVVWSEGYPSGSSNVFLYSDGEVAQVTDGTGLPTWPAINNNGDIVWRQRGDSTSPYEVTLWVDGQSVPVPGNPTALAPDINDLGHLALDSPIPGDGTNVELFFYDGNTTRQITDNGLSNQAQVINSTDDIAWTRYNFQVSPWTGAIMLYSGGVTSQLTSGTCETQGVSMNDRGQLVWKASGTCERDEVVVWDDGKLWAVPGLGNDAPMGINNLGQIPFARYNHEADKWDQWLYTDGQLYKLPDFGYATGSSHINNRGEMAIRGIDFENVIFAVLMLRRCDPPAGPPCTGDAQCDDADPCTEGRCECGHCTYPARLYGDVNEDGVVDLSDIVCVLDAFQGDFSTCAMNQADIGPCIPDGTIDLLDIFSVLDAFAGQDPCCG